MLDSLTLYTTKRYHGSMLYNIPCNKNVNANHNITDITTKQDSNTLNNNINHTDLNTTTNDILSLYNTYIANRSLHSIQLNLSSNCSYSFTINDFKKLT